MGYTAVVILNHKDNQNALELVDKMSAMPTVDRIAVADNSPSGEGLKGDEAQLRNDKTLFLEIKNNGYASGNNEAVRALEQRFGLPEFLVISNPDVVVPAESIAACLDFLRSHDDFAVAAPFTRRPDGTRHYRSGWRARSVLCDAAYSSGILSRLIGMFREIYPPEHWNAPFSEVDCVAGSFFVIRGGAFKQAGYFDEHTFLFYEEDILGYRLKQLGYKKAILNQVSFIHNEGVSADRHINYIKKYIIMQRSRLYYHRRYHKVPFYKLVVLYLATGLGFLESVVKTAIHKKPRLET